MKKIIEEINSSAEDHLSIKICNDEIYIQHKPEVHEGNQITVYDSEWDELFDTDGNVTEEEFSKLYSFYKQTYARAFRQGLRAGKREIKQKISEVVGFFAAGFMGDNKDE